MSNPYVPIEELAKHFSVSVSTIRMWVRNKHIPEDTYVNIGNTYRFSIDDVTEALTTGKVSVTAKVEDSSVAMAELGQPELDEDM